MCGGRGQPVGRWLHSTLVSLVLTLIMVFASIELRPPTFMCVYTLHMPSSFDICSNLCHLPERGTREYRPIRYKGVGLVVSAGIVLAVSPTALAVEKLRGQKAEIETIYSIASGLCGLLLLATDGAEGARAAEEGD